MTKTAIPEMQDAGSKPETLPDTDLAAVAAASQAPGAAPAGSRRLPKAEPDGGILVNNTDLG